MSDIYIVSDTHFGHGGILSFKREDGSPVRNFSCAEEMDECMVNSWNLVVRPQDHVYHLGDVAMKRTEISTVSRCNGHKRLVRGNHDVFRTKDYLPYFEEIYGIRVLDNMIFTHIPIHPESLGRFRANIHGHVHALPQGHFGPKYYNVCVEALGYVPVSLEDLKTRLPS
jgi:calcineurin-like phosphoesterase family protein